MRRTINIDLKCRVKYHQKTTSDCENSLSIRPSYGVWGEEILDGGGERGRRERKA